MNITVAPASRRLPDKSLLYHRQGVGEQQLKDMSARFNIKTDGERVLNKFIPVGSGIGKYIILGIQTHPFSQPYPPACAYCQDIGRVGSSIIQVAVKPRGCQLEREELAEFPGNKYLVNKGCSCSEIT